MKRGLIFMSGLTAFVIGAGASLTVGLAAGNGKLNDLAVLLIAFSGCVAAARDYRSLMKLPPVDLPGQGNGSVPINMNKTNPPGDGFYPDRARKEPE